MYVQHHAWQKGGRAAADEDEEEDEEGSDDADEDDEGAFEEQEWKKKVPKYAAKKGKHKVRMGARVGTYVWPAVCPDGLAVLRRAAEGVRPVHRVLGATCFLPLQGSNEGNHAWGIAQLVAISSVANLKGKKVPDNLKVRRQARAGSQCMQSMLAVYLPMAHPLCDCAPSTSALSPPACSYEAHRAPACLCPSLLPSLQVRRFYRPEEVARDTAYGADWCVAVQPRPSCRPPHTQGLQCVIVVDQEHACSG